MKILVTGANGYIGRHVITALLERGHEVTAADIRFSAPIEGARMMECNLLDGSAPGYDGFGRPGVCLHLAWRDGFKHDSAAHMGDLSAHFRFLTGLVEQGLPQLAVMGSMHEVGYHEGMITDDTPCRPLSQYGVAKDALRRALMLYCKEKCCLQWLRGYYITGDDLQNHSIFSKLLQAASEGKKTFPFTTGKTKYDFLSVTELARQIAATVSQTAVCGIINVCSGQPVSLADKVEEYIRENGLDIALEYGAFPDRPYDSPIIYGDPTKINTILENER